MQTPFLPSSLLTVLLHLCVSLLTSLPYEGVLEEVVMAVFTHLDNIHAVSEFCLELASHGCLQQLVSLQCTSLQVNSLSFSLPPSFLSSIRAFSLSACSTMIQRPLLPPTILPYCCSSLSSLCPYNPAIISHYLTTLPLLISLECVNERYNKVWIGLKIHQRNAKVGGVRFGVY